MYTTNDFDAHYHSYVLQLTTVKLVVCHTELFSYYPHHIRVLNGNIGYFYVVPKHHFVNVAD